MEVLVKITNEKLYNEKVVDIDVSGLKGNNFYKGRLGHFHATGVLSIELEGEPWLNIDGEFGSHDYEDDWGFVLYCEDLD